MQSHKNALLTRGGEVVPGASVYVYNVGTVTAATIYSDNGTTPITQPITTSSDGEYEFWAADGVYDVHITYSNATEDYEIVLFDPIRGGSSVDVTIGPTATPALFLDVSANQLQIGKGLTTQSSRLELGTGRTGDGFALIDLIGDATYTDYGVSLQRGATGANTTSGLYHRGTGALILQATDAGSISLRTNSTTALTVDSSQKIGIGISTPDTKLHVWSASAGTVSAAVNSVLTIENSTTAYLSILTPSTTESGIVWGDESDNTAASVLYNHAGTYLSIDVENLESLRLDANATAGNTRLLIYDVDNATLERVSVGAADSGGAGYKVLRIPN